MSFILHIYYIKTYGINVKEALRGDWEELNKKTYGCNDVMYVTKQLRGLRLYTDKPINFLIFSFARRCLPSKKQSINLFTQF